MTAPRVRHLLVLVVAGVVLVGSGLLLLHGAPRADAPDIGTVQAAAPSPAVPGASAQAAPPPRAAAPAAVSLPGVGEPVPLVAVGVLGSGALQLPERPGELGWYAAGAVPGDASGTAVVAGHVDSVEYGAGPLATLSALHLGDPIEVTDAVGGVHRYAVTSRTSYPKYGLPVGEIFRADGPARLALVTCGGAFDRRTGQYADNVVVLAEPVAAPEVGLP